MLNPNTSSSLRRSDNKANQRVFIILGMALLLSIGAAFPAGAQESKLKQIIQNKEIRIGTSGDYQPFSNWNSKSNDYEGMDIEMAKKVGASSPSQAGVHPLQMA